MTCDEAYALELEEVFKVRLGFGNGAGGEDLIGGEGVSRGKRVKADTIFSVARAHLIGLLFAILALTKSTLAPVCLVAGAYLIMREKCNRLAFVPAVYMLAVLGAWSWWSNETTGKWTHVANILSFDGINLYRGNNEFVEALYPEVHMDALDYAGLTDPPRDIQDKEWTVNDHFRQLALRYLSSDWAHALRFLLV